MKKNSFAWLVPSALLVLSGLAALPACDVISDPQKPTATISAGQRDTLALDSAEATHPVGTVVQNVLIEDYTGQYCGNCPRAAHMADSMLHKYPGRVIVTEVHVTSYFAAPRLPHFPLDFRVPDLAKQKLTGIPNTDVSDEITRTFDLDNRGLPQGAVSRAPFPDANNDPVATFSLWPGLVASELARTPTVDLRLTALFDRNTRLLRLKINTKYLAAMLGRNLNLGLVMIEDSLVGAQKDYRLNRTQYPEQTVEEYDHHNVTRAVLAGTFGSPQVSSPTAGQQLVSYLGYQMPAASVWNDRKCSVIAYIADADTRHILQVVQAKLP